MPAKSLNLDIPKSISDFEEVMKRFLLKKKIYRIIFRGRGLDFDGYRDFGPDEDAEAIDWKASIRGNKLLARKYIEERDLKIIFVIDVGENMVFGSQEKLKCEYATEVVAALSHLIMSQNDNVGFIVFNDKIKTIIPPKKGKNHFNLLMSILSDPLLYGGKSDIGVALDYLVDYGDKSINSVILVSDFLNIKKEDVEKLKLAASRFETLSIIIKDPLDMTLPNIEGEMIIEDPISKEQMIINPKIARKTYEKYATEQEKRVLDSLTDANIDFLKLDTKEKFIYPLAIFLQERVESKKYSSIIR